MLTIITAYVWFVVHPPMFWDEAYERGYTSYAMVSVIFYIVILSIPGGKRNTKTTTKRTLFDLTARLAAALQ